MYYRGAQAAIVVYDIQNRDSFQRAKTWVKELQRQVIRKQRCNGIFHQDRFKIISGCLSDSLRI